LMQYNVGMGMLPNKGANIGTNTLKSSDITLETFLKKMFDSSRANH